MRGGGLTRIRQRAARIVGGAAARVQRPSEKFTPEYWKLSRGPGEELEFEGVSLAGLADEHGTPLHVFMPSKLRRNIELFHGVDLASGGRGDGPTDTSGSLPSLFFSYKTAPVPGLLRRIHDAGVGAEVISAQELDLALSLGVPGSHIIYNGPAKSDASLERAIQEGIFLININHQGEVARVEEVAARLGSRVRVGLRVTAGGGWGQQFGEDVDGNALTAAREIVSAPSLDLVALHLHRGHVNSVVEVAEVAEAGAAFADRLRTTLGVGLEILDVGGGLWPPTVRELSGVELRRNSLLQWDLERFDPQLRYSIAHYVSDTLRLVEHAFSNRGMAMPRVVMEPGRALVGDTQLLLARVMEIKKARGRDYLILDTGINIAGPLQNEFHEIYPVKPSSVSGLSKYKLVGPICVPTDCIRSTWYGPPMNVGDYLVIMDTGAYFVPWSNSFSFPRPGIIAVEGGASWVLRRAETLDYLIALDVDEAQ